MFEIQEEDENDQNNNNGSGLIDPNCIYMVIGGVQDIMDIFLKVFNENLQNDKTGLGDKIKQYTDCSMSVSINSFPFDLNQMITDIFKGKQINLLELKNSF